MKLKQHEVEEYITDYAKANPNLTPEQFAKGIIAGLAQLEVAAFCNIYLKPN